MHELPCSVQVTVGLYHVAGKTLKREQFLSVTTVGYSAVIFGCALLLLCSWSFTPQDTKGHSKWQCNLYALLNVF